MGGMDAIVCRSGLFNTQVCMPKEWTDEQAMEFAERERPCGTTGGWQVRLAGDETRVQCERHDENVHIMLDA